MADTTPKEVSNVLKAKLEYIGITDVTASSHKVADVQVQAQAQSGAADGKRRVSFDGLSVGVKAKAEADTAVAGVAELLEYRIVLPEYDGVVAGSTVISFIPKDGAVPNALLLQTCFIIASNVPASDFPNVYDTFNALNPALPIGSLGIYRDIGGLYYKDSFFIFSETPADIVAEHALQQMQWLAVNLKAVYGIIMDIE